MASLEDSLEKELECPICREELSQPKIAGPCGHTFCQECLGRHIQTGPTMGYRQFDCPFCRSACVIPQKGVRGLATNFPVARIIESLNKSRQLREHAISKPCELCKGVVDVAAEQACAACDGMILCKTCGRQHQKHPATKNHEVTGICEPHGKPLRYYCRTCDALLCVLCRAPKVDQGDHSHHDVVPYHDVVSTGRHELRTALRTARKETKGELEEIEGRLKYLLTEETTALNTSRNEIENSVEDAVKKNKARIKKRDSKIKLLLQEVARLRQDNTNTSEQNTRFVELRDNITQNLEDTRGKAEDDVNASKGEIISLMHPLRQRIQHGQSLMAEKTLMPDLRSDLNGTTQQLNELSSNAKEDRLSHVQERITLRKSDFRDVVDLLKDFSNCVDTDDVLEDSAGKFEMSMTEIGLEYFASRGEGASGFTYLDLKIPSGIKRIHGISMSGKRTAGCGQCKENVYSLWMWDATESNILLTGDVPMMDLATVDKDELVILRSENPFLRLLNVVTNEVHDIHIKQYDRVGVLSVWQIAVITAEKFVLSYRTKDRVHHVAIVNKEGSILQDIRVEQRQCITFCRIKSVIVTCSFSGTTLTVYSYDSEQGTNEVMSDSFSEMGEFSEGFQCADICSGSLGEVYIVGRTEQQLFQPAWKKNVKEIEVYHLALNGFGEDAPFGRDVEVQRLATPGLEMRSAWAPKCAMGGRPNTLLVEYGNEVRVITLKVLNELELEDSPPSRPCGPLIVSDSD